MYVFENPSIGRRNGTQLSTKTQEIWANAHETRESL